MATALVRLVGAILAGLGFALTFAPVNAWYLAPIAVVVFIWIVRTGSWWQSLILGFISGASYSIVTLHWLSPVGVDTVGMLAGLFGLWFALLAIGVQLVWRLPLAPLWVACWWVLIEFGFSNVPLGGFGWLRLAFGQDDSWFTVYARGIGVAGVSFLVALVGALIARLVEWLIASRSPAASESASQRSIMSAVGSLLVLAAVIVGGIAFPPLVYPVAAYETLTVAAVQGSVPGAGLNSLGEKAAVIRNHVAATEQLAQDVAAGEVAQPHLVIWPENSTDIDPLTDLSVRAQIDSAADAIKAPILVGAVRVNDTQPPTLHNSGILWWPRKGAGQEYVKQHLVPFGEYMPMRDVVSRFTDRVALVPNDFVSGDQPGVLQVNDTTFGDLICYEVLSDSVIRGVMQQGVPFLVVQANNATYIHDGPGGLIEPQQLLDIVKVRAVETGRSIVLATTNGITATVDSDGRVIDRIPPIEPGSLVTEVPIRTDQTLAMQFGSYVEYGLALLGLVAVVAGIVTRNRYLSP